MMLVLFASISAGGRTYEQTIKKIVAPYCQGSTGEVLPSYVRNPGPRAPEAGRDALNCMDREHVIASARELQDVAREGEREYLRWWREPSPMAATKRRREKTRSIMLAREDTLDGWTLYLHCHPEQCLQLKIEQVICEKC